MRTFLVHCTNYQFWMSIYWISGLYSNSRHRTELDVNARCTCWHSWSFALRLLAIKRRACLCSNLLCSFRSVHAFLILLDAIAPFSDAHHYFLAGFGLPFFKLFYVSHACSSTCLATLRRPFAYCWHWSYEVWSWRISYRSKYTPKSLFSP